MKEVPEGGAGAAYIGCVGRFLGAIFGSGSETSGSVAKGALRTGDSMTDARLRSQRFAPLIYRGHVYELQRLPCGGIPARPTRNSQLSSMA